MKNPHLDEGIAHLKEAVNHGLAPHVTVATQHAESAVTAIVRSKVNYSSRGFSGMGRGDPARFILGT